MKPSTRAERRKKARRYTISSVRHWNWGKEGSWASLCLLVHDMSLSPYEGGEDYGKKGTGGGVSNKDNAREGVRTKEVRSRQKTHKEADGDGRMTKTSREVWLNRRGQIFTSFKPQGWRERPVRANNWVIERERKRESGVGESVVTSWTNTVQFYCF